jgi:hypothetical protein
VSSNFSQRGRADLTYAVPPTANPYVSAEKTTDDVRVFTRNTVCETLLNEIGQTEVRQTSDGSLRPAMPTIYLECHAIC